jgi:hypothetical protein
VPIDRRFFIASLLAAGVGLGFGVKAVLHQQKVYVEVYEDGRAIPVGGLLVNPHGLENLEYDAEDDFRRLAVALREYVDKHEKLPDHPHDLLGLSDGSGGKIDESAFYSQDSERADHPGQPGFSYSWAWRGPRADGAPKPARPASGERDVWVFSEDYVRSGRRVYRNGTYRSQPEGYYVVLWSDGAVERVPPQDRVLVGSGAFESTYFFRGEVGVPADARTASDHLPERGRWWPAPAPMAAKVSGE